MRTLLLAAFLPVLLATAQTPASGQAPASPPSVKDEKPKPAEEPKPAKPEPPPEMKAYSAAAAEKDPQKKIEALKKFLADFPKSAPAGAARIQLLSATLKVSPTDESKIRPLIRQVIKKSTKQARPGTYQSVANVLLDNGVLLDEAEKYARKAVNAVSEKEFIASSKKSAAEAKPPRTPPTDAELHSRYVLMQSFRWNTLGRVLAKRGKEAEAETMLTQALNADPTMYQASMVLGDFAAKRGQTDAALNFYTDARLSGRLKGADLEKFDAAYTKKYGSLGGVEEYLDTMYHKKFPNPLHAEKYVPTGNRSDRVALIEVFTGSGCPPCVAADLAFDVALERYSRNEVAVVMFHQHIPQPDPMTNPDSRTRFKWYARGGVPTWVVDGKADGGGGPRDAVERVWKRVNPDLEKRLETPAGAKIQLDARLDGQIVKAKASVSNLNTEKKAKLVILLVEEHLRYTGENGVRFHPMVVRDIAGEEVGEGFALDPAKPAPVEHSFDIEAILAGQRKHLEEYEKEKEITFSQKLDFINRSRLAVVAYVQDEESKEILQTAFVKVKNGAVSD